MAAEAAVEKKDAKQQAFEAFHTAMKRHESRHRYVKQKEEDLAEARESLRESQEDLIQAREALFQACPELTMETDELLSDPSQRAAEND